MFKEAHACVLQVTNNWTVDGLCLCTQDRGDRQGHICRFRARVLTVLDTAQDFWSNVVGRATKRVGQFTGF